MADIVANNRNHVKRNAGLVACIALIWVVIDFASKRFFDGGAFSLGEHIAGPFLGLFRFTLVHNTGAAWGLFAGKTFALGIFSLVMCVALAVYLFKFAKDAGVITALGIGLVIGGGIGNAIDRLFGQYVIDFIDFTFMDFPVFNIADIGVTCGIVIFVIGMLLDMREEDKRLKEQDQDGDQSVASSEEQALDQGQDGEQSQAPTAENVQQEPRLDGQEQTQGKEQ